MRLAFLTVIVLLLAPSALASSRADPAGDEEITPVAGNLGAACSDPAGDIVGFAVESDGATLRASLAFLDAGAPLDCLGQPLGTDVTRSAGVRLVGDSGTLILRYFRHTNGLTEACFGESCRAVAPGDATWEVALTPAMRGNYVATAFADSFHARDNNVVLRTVDRTSGLAVTV